MQMKTIVTIELTNDKPIPNKPMHEIEESIRKGYDVAFKAFVGAVEKDAVINVTSVKVEDNTK